MTRIDENPSIQLMAKLNFFLGKCKKALTRIDEIPSIQLKAFLNIFKKALTRIDANRGEVEL